MKKGQLTFSIDKDFIDQHFSKYDRIDTNDILNNITTKDCEAIHKLLKKIVAKTITDIIVMEFHEANA